MAVAAGCRPGAPDPAPSVTSQASETAPAVLRWALGSDPTSLDPAVAVTDDDLLLADALFDGLTRLDEDLQPAPSLATAWRANADATSFTFDLDPAAVWHDGTTVTADDVVRGLRRVADGDRRPASLHGPLLSDVVGYAAARVGQPLRGVVAVDERTVRIDLSRPVPELPSILAHPALAPVPAPATEDPQAFGEAPVGNGPFRLAEPWAHNQFLRLAPSASHPDPDALDEIVFRVYASDEDRATRHADLLAGQLQVSQLPAGRRGEVLADPRGVTLLEGFADTTSLLLFDTRQPLFDDVRFRRGVSMLVDRDALADRTGGARTAATSLVPPSLPGAVRAACAWCRHDPDAAAALLGRVLDERTRAGLGPPPPIVVQTSTDELHGTMADQLSAALRSAGLEVRVVRADPATYLEVAGAEQPAVVRLAWSPEAPTLRAWTERLFGAGELGARLTGWQPESLRDLLARADASADLEVRREAWQEVERLALDAAVVAPVLHYRDDLLVAADVEGLERDPYGNVDLAQVRLRRTSAP